MVTALNRSRRFTSIFSIVSVLMLLISMVFPNAKASAEVMTHTKYQSKGWVFSNKLGFFVETDLIKLADGRIVYCLDERLGSPNGHDLEPMGRLNDETYRVLEYGYPNKNPEELGVSTWEEAHYATRATRF